MSAESSGEAAARVERSALRFSTLGYLGMAGLGIGFAVATRSEAILLDGVYSFVSAGATLAALRVAALVHHPGTKSFHFGFAHLEPLVNALRGVLILGISVFALTSAVGALFAGGRPIAAGWAVVYAVAAFTLCQGMAWNQRRLSKRVGSPLLAVDARNWFVDGVVSGGAGLAFVGALLVRGTSLDRLSPYVDPALVTLIVFVMAPIPLKVLWDNLREVLQAAPAHDVQAQVRERITGALADLPARTIQIRMVKIGRFFYVLTHVVLPPDWRAPSVGGRDEIRCRAARSLQGIPERLVTDTIFVADERWTSLDDDRSCAPSS